MPARESRETSAAKRRGGWQRLAVAVRSSGRGLAAAWRHELAFRIECIVLIFALPLALWLGKMPLEQAALIAVVAAITTPVP